MRITQAYSNAEMHKTLRSMYQFWFIFAEYLIQRGWKTKHITE